MFCTPGAGSDSIIARVSCGLDYYFSGQGIGDDVDDEDEQRSPERRAVSWLVAKAPKAMQRPIVFNQNGYESFRTMSTKPSDILIASYPRCGLSWIQAITWFLMRSDDEGRLPNGWQRWDGSRGPTYCEDRTATRMAPKRVANQQDPRIFTTHARPEHWPNIIADGGKIIIITRDPRDAMVSTFFRLRELGIELRAFGGLDDRVFKCAKACDTQSLDSVFDDFNDNGDKVNCLSLLIDDPQEKNNASSHQTNLQQGKNGGVEPYDATKSKNRRFYADYYTWHAEIAKLMDIYGSDRFLLVTYEDLQENPVKVTKDVYAFLVQAPTTSNGNEDPRQYRQGIMSKVASQAKINNAIDFASFENIQARGNAALRKGVVGDHRVYLTPEHWEAMVRKTLLNLIQYPQLRSVCHRLVQDTPNALRILSESDRCILEPLLKETDTPLTSAVKNATDENNIIRIPLENPQDDHVVYSDWSIGKEKTDASVTQTSQTKNIGLPAANSAAFRRPNLFNLSRIPSSRRSTVASPKTSQRKNATSVANDSRS